MSELECHFLETEMPAMFGYVITFLPWIAFAVIGTSDDSRYGALVACAIAIVLVVDDRLVRRKPWDALVIEGSSALFFGVLAIIAFTVTRNPFGGYGAAVSDVWLALTAWGSLAVRHPFTLGIARTMTTADVQATPVFYRVNAVITAVWAAAFTVTATLLAIMNDADPHATGLIIAIKVVTFVAPAVFTIRYPKVVRARYATQS